MLRKSLIISRNLSDLQISLGKFAEEKLQKCLKYKLYLSNLNKIFTRADFVIDMAVHSQHIE